MLFEKLTIGKTFFKITNKCNIKLNKLVPIFCKVQHQSIHLEYVVFRNNGLLSDERARAGAHTCRGSEGQVGWTQNYRGRNYPPRDRYTTAQTVIDIPLLRQVQIYLCLYMNIYSIGQAGMDINTAQTRAEIVRVIKVCIQNLHVSFRDRQ